MANPVILVPPFNHVPENISSATSESGLTVAAATEDSTNRGTLRIRTSGTPLSTLALHLKLATGGNARGYDEGAGFLWRNASEPDSMYRGYTEGFVLRQIRARPLSTYGGIAGSPRQMADGRMGYTAGSLWHAETIDNVVTRTSTGLSPDSGRMSDSVILPSGRIVVFAQTGGASGGSDVQMSYSDDNGATFTTVGVVIPQVQWFPVRDVLCVELVSADTVFLLLGCSNAGGAATSAVFWSRDGGFTFSEVPSTEQFLTNPRTCVTKTGSVLITDQVGGGGYLQIYEAVPGGSPVYLSNAPTPGTSNQSAIACRDDGTVWAWNIGSSAGGTDLKMTAAVSADGGLTWSSPSASTATVVKDFAFASASTTGFRYLSAGAAWGGVVVLGQTQNVVGTGEYTITWRAGTYETVGEYGKTYRYTYTPIDYPQNVGWTRVDSGAGATLSFSGSGLAITATATDTTDFRSSASWWTTSDITEVKRVRMRLGVYRDNPNIADNRCMVLWQMYDGAGFTYGLRLRLTGTQASFVDSDTGTVRVTVSIPAATCDWIVETKIGTTGIIFSAWVADAAPADGTFNFVQVADNLQTGTKLAGLADRLSFGGAGGTGSSTLTVHYIDHAPDVAKLTSVRGRYLSSAYDVWVKDGVLVGGVNAYGFPGDVFYITTAYTYGKDNTWQEYRPSRYVQSSADGTPWRIVFDAGSAGRFSATHVALLGTNFRTAQFQMNATDSWGSPSLSVNLDATEESFATFTGAPGFIAPYSITGVTLRPHQYRSDGDAHRWFLEVGTATGPKVYEITDNDDERIFCEGVSFVGTSGPARVFRDRLGASFTESTYRYASIVIDTQDTSDGGYRLGTPVFGKGYQLPQSYDYGFVDRTEANVSLTTTPAGYRAAARLGPRRHALSVQWSPINRRDPVRGETDRAIADAFAALEGSRTPFVFWRDGSVGNDCSMVRVTGTLARTNVWGEGATALTRVDQVTLEEEL